MPDKCQWCGAEIEHKKRNITQYGCLSTTNKEGSWQSALCKDRQISRLKARAALLEKVAMTAEKYFDLDPGDTGYVQAKTVLWEALKDLEAP